MINAQKLNRSCDLKFRHALKTFMDKLKHEYAQSHTWTPSPFFSSHTITHKVSTHTHTHLIRRAWRNRVRVNKPIVGAESLRCAWLTWCRQERWIEMTEGDSGGGENREEKVNDEGGRRGDGRRCEMTSWQRRMGGGRRGHGRVH